MPPEGHLRGAGPPTSCDAAVGLTASLHDDGPSTAALAAARGHAAGSAPGDAVALRSYSTVHRAPGVQHGEDGGPARGAEQLLAAMSNAQARGRNVQMCSGHERHEPRGHAGCGAAGWTCALVRLCRAEGGL